MLRNFLLKFLCLLLAFQLSFGRTVTTHRETKIDPNGRKYTKVWTTYDEEPPADDESATHPVLENPFKLPMNFPGEDDVEILPSSFGGHQLPQDSSFIGKDINSQVVQEVLRTKKPVITTTTDPDGTIRTTTYKLEPDGSISKQTLLQRKPTITRHQWVETKPNTMPIDLDPWTDFGTQFKNWPGRNQFPNPWTLPEDTEMVDNITPTTSTTTTTMKPEVTTTPKPITKVTPISTIDKDIHSQAVQEVLRTKKPVMTTTTDPDGTIRTTTYKLDPDGSISKETHFQRNPTITRHQWVETKPNTMPIDDPWTDFGKQFKNWPEQNQFPNPWTLPEDTEMIDNITPTTSTTPKPITKVTPISTTPKPPHRHILKTTTALPSLEAFLRTTTPLPNLEDFLKIQYGKTTPKPSNISPQPVTAIQLEDIPITAVLTNGKPVRPEDFVKSLPEDNSDPPQAKSISPDVAHTRVRTFTQTMNTPSNPKMDDFEPNMQDIIRRAGITPDELESANGDITKTRTEPDGRVITTRYKVQKMPTFTPYSPDLRQTPPSMYHPDLHSSGSRAGVKFPTPYDNVDKPKKDIIPLPSIFNRNYPTTSLLPEMEPIRPSFQNPIDEFLALLNLRAEDILSSHGVFNKNIVDGSGRVLSMRLVLSVPMSSQEEAKALPNK